MRRRWPLLAVAFWLALAASAGAQPFVYVASQNGSVSQFDSLGGPLAPLNPATVLSGPADSTPTGIAVSPDGQRVYVANQFADSVSQYTVGLDGMLTPETPATVTADKQPVAVAVSPDGLSVYTANFAGPIAGDVSQYDLSPTGTLSSKSPATVSAGVGTSDVAISRDGLSVYVTNEGDGTISQYNVGARGALTPKTPATLGTGGSAFRIAITPNGRYLYVSDLGAIAQFNVGPGGALTAAGFGSGFVAAPDSRGLAVSPDGASLYVASASPGKGSVLQFTIGSDGALTPQSPAALPAGTGPQGVAVSPDGHSVYVTDEEGAAVLQYAVGLGGGLSPRTPASQPTAGAPVAIAITPTPAVRPSATTVSCTPESIAPGQSASCTATVSGGSSNPTGTVSFTASGTGAFAGDTCTLSNTRCTVTFSSLALGGHFIAASYGGDATRAASHGLAGVTVGLPESTNGCAVFGHGRLITAVGDRARFAGLAVGAPARGFETYADRGPVSPLALRSVSVQALTCAADASVASVYGQAWLAPSATAPYRIDVTAETDRGVPASFRIRLGSGYDSGVKPLVRGGVRVVLTGRRR